MFYFTSGAIYPVAGFPDWKRDTAVASPQAQALLIYKRAAFTAVAGDFGFLRTFTAMMRVKAAATSSRVL